MAKFSSELPHDLIKQFKELAEGGAEKMMSEMVSAGLEVVEKNIRKNMKRVFKDASRLEKCLRVTRVYRTQSDDGINKKVAFYGYLEGTEGKTTKRTVKKTYAKLNKKGKAIWQNKNRVGVTSVKTYSHNYGVPAPLVAMAREYGTSNGERAKPFVKPAFKKAQITSAMMTIQGKYLKDE